jgi:UDP-glucose 4-epimerase
MAEYLVTGGAGFIGSHLVTRFVQDGHRVRVVDNLSSGTEKNLAHLDGRYEFFRGDLRNPDDCRTACRDISIVFHEAAVPSVPRSVDDPQTSHDVNVTGTFNLLMAARDAGCKRVVYAASSSAYGETQVSPKREDITPQPLSPYAVGKLLGEHYGSVFTKCYGLETISLRYFNVFGPRQNPRSQYAAAIPAFITHILKGESPTVYGDGEQTRDFTHIDNVVHANVLAARAAKTAGESVNIGYGSRVSVNGVIAKINELLEKHVRPKYVAPRPGDVRHSLADISRARAVLGYEPVMTFDDGLRRCIEWFTEHPS